MHHNMVLHTVLIMYNLIHKKDTFNNNNAKHLEINK